MADLHVQQKKKPSFLPWLLLLLGIAVLLWILLGRSKDKYLASSTAATTISADTTKNVTSGTTAEDWGGVDFNAPAINYDEITDKNINVRGNSNYGIYGLGENILFDEGKATIRSNAEANLKQIVTSVNKRYNGGELRVYGFTDSQGSAGSNKELAQQRADAVKGWLQNNGIDADHISVNGIGEAQPVANNDTEEGRQQNRRVEIVARGGSGK